MGWGQRQTERPKTALPSVTEMYCVRLQLFVSLLSVIFVTFLPLNFGGVQF